MCVRCIAQCIKFVLFEVTKVSVQYFVWKVCKWCLAEMWTLLKFEQTDCYKPLDFFPSLSFRSGVISQQENGKTVSVSNTIRIPVERKDNGAALSCEASHPALVGQKRVRHYSLDVHCEPTMPSRFHGYRRISWLTLLLARRSPICLNMCTWQASNKFCLFVLHLACYDKGPEDNNIPLHITPQC